MAVIEVTDKNFESEVLKSQLPVLADFWAEWCGPCKMISPIVEEISDELDGKDILQMKWPWIVNLGRDPCLFQAFLKMISLICPNAIVAEG